MTKYILEIQTFRNIRQVTIFIYIVWLPFTNNPKPPPLR